MATLITVLCIVGGITGLFLLLFLSPIKFRIRYKEDALRIRMRYLFFFLTLHPKKQKPIKTGTEAPAAPVEAPSKPKKPKPGFKYWLNLILEILEAFKSKFRGKIKIGIKQITVSVGGSDAAACAIAYGAVHQGLSLLYGFLDSNFSLSKKAASKIEILPNFIGKETDIVADLSVSVSLLQGVKLLLSMLKASSRAKKLSTPAVAKAMIEDTIADNGSET